MCPHDAFENGRAKLQVSIALERPMASCLCSLGQGRKELAMTHPTSDEELALVNAYVDGELGPASSVFIEELMSGDPELAAEYRHIVALQRLVRERLPREFASRPCLPKRPPVR